MDPKLLSQIHLSGESSCPAFVPHMLKANMCTSCSKLINKHSVEAIPDEQCLLKVWNSISSIQYLWEGPASSMGVHVHATSNTGNFC